MIGVRRDRRTGMWMPPATFRSAPPCERRMIGRYSCRQQRDGAETLYGCTYRRFGGGLYRYGHLLRLFGRGASAYRGWRSSLRARISSPPVHATFWKAGEGAFLPALSWCRPMRVDTARMPCRAGELLCVGPFSLALPRPYFRNCFEMSLAVSSRTFSQPGVSASVSLPVPALASRGRRQ